MQRLLTLGGLLAIAALAGGYFLAARQATYRVSGPSMAPALLGPHYEVVCPECGHAFAIDATRGPLPTATCDYCGAIAAVKTGEVIAGDAIQPKSGEIERLDLVMFPDPDDPAQQVVKRIVGLPGETIAGRDGDLWINGRRYQKSWEEFRRVAIPVFETTGLIEQSPPHLIKSADGSIAYHHQVHSQGIQLSGESPPLDDYPYNQGLPGKLRPIRDLGLVCQLQGDEAPLALAIIHRDGEWRRKFAADSAEKSLDVGLALCDGRLISNRGAPVSIDETELATCELAATPLRLSTGGNGGLGRFLVLRDIHYADFPETKVPAHAYYVLGDNVLASRDSREFGPISAKNVRGMVPASKPD
ncbi:S26 family signal peptidase [Blastopirellula retiformator]|uniref:Signal peptidase I n=1 Tax=Blastopirellula retiformator TaxID=2527970 RepID=A0A5C5V213_9BACT|nr:S26 family signal peptidase [Blastopirellula retiformator]TWT32644.1 signal peptidase I [Blastopirellula retiformator]